MKRQRERKQKTSSIHRSITIRLATIALSTAPANLMATPVNHSKVFNNMILPQSQSLIGYVYDQNKNPLAGVTVKVEGIQLVTVTDDEAGQTH